MSNKKLYQQKLQAQLDEWEADLNKLKAKASGASADAKLEMNQHIENMQAKIDEGKAKLSELAETSDDAWESIKEGVESTWESLKSGFHDAVSKIKD